MKNFFKPFKPKKVKGVADHYPAEVTQENRRLTGNTPRKLKAFAESPARFLPRASGGGGGSLKAMAMAGKK